MPWTLPMKNLLLILQFAEKSHPSAIEALKKNTSWNLKLVLMILKAFLSRTYIVQKNKALVFIKSYRLEDFEGITTVAFCFSKLQVLRFIYKATYTFYIFYSNVLSTKKVVRL